MGQEGSPGRDRGHERVLRWRHLRLSLDLPRKPLDLSPGHVAGGGHLDEAAGPRRAEAGAERRAEDLAQVNRDRLGKHWVLVQVVDVGQPQQSRAVLEELSCRELEVLRHLATERQRLGEVGPC